MKKILIIIIGLCAFTVGFPYFFTGIFNGWNVKRETQIENSNSGINISLEIDGEYKVLDLEEYLAGVVASQIPVEYSEEAIKAQAVIARTNILKEVNLSPNIDGADLEEVYLCEKELKDQWGEIAYEENIKKIRKAVYETSGIVLKYEGQYIDAFYHQVSIGKTISTKELYDKEVPYLVSVESPMDIESINYMNITMYSIDEINNILSLIVENKNNTEIDNNIVGENKPETEEEIALNENQELGGLINNNSSFMVKETTKNGYVKSVIAGNTEFSGDSIKEAFKLNSANFYIEKVDNQYRIVTLGLGCGLGLSQFGANKMAQEGKDYVEILKYYFTGITVEDEKEGN